MNCGSTSFCCVFDEDTSIDTVTLKGTNGSDDGLSFTYALGTGSERNLDAGIGYWDYCGNADVLSYPTDYPLYCDQTIDVEPTQCAGQN